MMEAPRWALSGLVVSLAIAFSGHSGQSQDAAKPIQAEIKKVEEKIKEETERVARKKENLQVEFAALHKDETKAALQAKLAEIGAKHRAAVNGGAATSGSDSRPVVPEAVRTAIQDECRNAIGATVGRNLATVLDAPLSSNLIELLRGNAPLDYQLVLKETINEVFEGEDFEANYKKLIPVFERKLLDLQGELASLKQRGADADLEARGRQLGIPPGMVLVPGGKYRIGSDASEFDAIKKQLGFLAGAGNIDKYALGWPAHDVELEDFFIDINEVTNRQWAEFVKDTERKPPAHWKQLPDKKDPSKTSIPLPNGGGNPATTTQPSSGTGLMPEWMEDLPITYVTPDDILLFCEWCGRRLPTEFEWEAAARYKAPGDKSFRWYPWGDVYDRTKPFCNNQTAAGHPLRQRHETTLTPVGSFPLGKSALGINDLAGNAAELTSSFFTAYPGWNEAKAPSNNVGKETFSGSLYVLRGGTSLASEMYTLTTTRMRMTRKSAEAVGFRTALSKKRGKDFLHSIAGNNQLAGPLESVGPGLKDEKSGRAELALNDSSRYSALIAGGWDAARSVPIRAQYIGLACRNTLEFTDAAKVKSLAREHKKPLMLGYFTTAVDLTKPEIPKGSYWVMWDPGRTIGTGKEKKVAPEGIIFRSTSNLDNIYDIPNVNPVLVNGSSEATKLSTDKSGSNLSVLLSFPVRDRKPNEARFIVEIKLETAPEALKPFK